MKAGRLAIVGAGSSGLVTLKFAVEQLPGWEIVCFEKSGSTIGRWGNPYPGFVSTSTKFTTQFSCFRKWNCDVDPKVRASKGDFFHNDEYGRYLEEFVRHFQLAPFIRLRTAVRRVAKDSNGGWRLWIGEDSSEQHFDQLVICTGLAEKTKTLDSPIPCLRTLDDPIRNQTVVVLGGGESAADVAHRLCDPGLNNRVYLSLKHGIRVSPRYHPVRGVPSDYLRNRLLMSIHPDIRNAVGQKFVEARIRHQEKFEGFFGSFPPELGLTPSQVERRKEWDAKLTSRAKDQLFNVFHTKSDDFLDDVATERLRIIGPPLDATYCRYSDFDNSSVLDLTPDALYPMIGFTAGVAELTQGEMEVKDFHLGCIHPVHTDLFLVGFARPIIGNIPTMSEMQARYVIGLVGGRFKRMPDLEVQVSKQRHQMEADFPHLNLQTIYPVEMFPYCDHLARLMGTLPTLRRVGSIRTWLKIQLAPVSTTYYLDEDFDAAETQKLPMHSPWLITVLLFLIKLPDVLYRLLRVESKRTPRACQSNSSSETVAAEPSEKRA